MVPAVPNQRPTAMTPMEGPRPTAGQTLDPGRFASDKWATDDLPTAVLEAAGPNATSEQNKRFLAAKKAATSAQENMNDARGITPGYNHGKRYTNPDDATNYPAW